MLILMKLLHILVLMLCVILTLVLILALWFKIGILLLHRVLIGAKIVTHRVCTAHSVERMLRTGRDMHFLRKTSPIDIRVEAHQ